MNDEKPFWQIMATWLVCCLPFTALLGVLAGAWEPLLGNGFAIVIFVPFTAWLESW